jgi:hypothetical protein
MALTPNDMDKYGEQKCFIARIGDGSKFKDELYKRQIIIHEKVANKYHVLDIKEKEIYDIVLFEKKFIGASKCQCNMLPGIYPHYKKCYLYNEERHKVFLNQVLEVKNKEEELKDHVEKLLKDE